MRRRGWRTDARGRRCCSGRSPPRYSRTHVGVRAAALACSYHTRTRYSHGYSHSTHRGTHAVLTQVHTLGTHTGTHTGYSHSTHRGTHTVLAQVHTRGTHTGSHAGYTHRVLTSEGPADLRTDQAQLAMPRRNMLAERYDDSVVGCKDRWTYRY